jgi:hypothetical protein
MEVEAVGETPAAYAIVEGTTLPTRKRHYSSSPERDREELQRVLRTVKPLRFSSKSI